MGKEKQTGQAKSPIAGVRSWINRKPPVLVVALGTATILLSIYFLRRLFPSLGETLGSLWDRTDWGSLPAWLGGIGTVATLTMAIRAVRGEQAAARQREVEARAQQASNVWIEKGAVVQGGGVGGRLVSVIVHNDSAQPVYRVSVHRRHQPGGTPAPPHRDMCELIAPGHTKTLLVSEHESWPTSTIGHFRAWFTDSQGHAWEKPGAGLLRLQSEAAEGPVLEMPPDVMPTRQKHRWEFWKPYVDLGTGGPWPWGERGRPEYSKSKDFLQWFLGMPFPTPGQVERAWKREQERLAAQRREKERAAKETKPDEG